MDVDAYLRRLRYDGPRQPSFETFCALHRQHLFNIPFENLNIALGWPIQLDPDTLFDKIVVRRRGGFCYELNGLFYELLVAIGFQVARLSARVFRKDGTLSPEFDHMLLMVKLDQPYIADVGFGDSFVEPLPMILAETADHPEFAVVAAGEAWDVVRQQADAAVAPQYRFTNMPREMHDFAGMCHFHQTSPESHFTQNRICSLALPDGRVTLSGMRLIETRNGERRERLLGNPLEIQTTLRERFGVEFNEPVDWSKLSQ